MTIQPAKSAPERIVLDGRYIRLEPLAQHPGDLLGPEHLLEDRPVGRGEHQPVGRVLVQAEPAVPGHRLRDRRALHGGADPFR